MSKIKIASLQTMVYADKQKNLDKVAAIMEANKDNGIDLFTLPETFNCPYKPANFPVYAEKEGGQTYEYCSNLAKKYGVYLSAGSIPELDDEGHVYNTAYVFDRDGNQIGKHRKVHLFDIDVKGGQRFFESETLTPGFNIDTFDTEFCKMGVSVCFDFRFPETGRLMALEGAKVLLVPAAFNMTTGPAHWEILFRCRAMENQVFAVGTAPARDLSFSYHSWGHTMVVNPWGTIINELDEKEGILITEIDLTEVDKYRGEIPMMNNRRKDVYTLAKLKK
ncbi:MAG: carbon-nitrogen hydrolase family protein [Christensenellaceae bacterium]|nr:carbon-nitrogen hydrolase family protein [Christensenellaceae bacterium]